MNILNVKKKMKYFLENWSNWLNQLNLEVNLLTISTQGTLDIL